METLPKRIKILELFLSETGAQPCAISCHFIDELNGWFWLMGSFIRYSESLTIDSCIQFNSIHSFVQIIQASELHMHNDFDSDCMWLWPQLALLRLYQIFRFRLDLDLSGALRNDILSRHDGWMSWLQWQWQRQRIWQWHSWSFTSPHTRWVHCHSQCQWSTCHTTCPTISPTISRQDFNQGFAHKARLWPVFSVVSLSSSNSSDVDSDGWIGLLT